jgi:hypothetical protein
MVEVANHPHFLPHQFPEILNYAPAAYRHIIGQRAAEIAEPDLGKMVNFIVDGLR